MHTEVTEMNYVQSQPSVYVWTLRTLVLVDEICECFCALVCGMTTQEEAHKCYRFLRASFELKTLGECLLSFINTLKKKYSETEVSIFRKQNQKVV